MTDEKKQKDPREHVNIVFIGHVDAGKSTLGGQIMYSTGQVDDRTIEKYTREAKEKNRDSWYLAFVMDCSEEEKEKGKTVHAARAHFETEKKRYTVIDAPGHKAYVPNMIGGASQADVAILVISARRGEFEAGFEQGGQTREHTMLAKTLGVERLIVVINKMDESTVQWSEERYNEIVDKLTPYLKKLGFKSKAFQFLPVSGFTGANIKNPIDSHKCPWYKGPTFLDALDDLDPIERNESGPLRMPVIDKYKDRGTMVVLGKIETGTVRVDDKVLIMPSNKEVEVAAIKSHDIDVDEARPGENVELHLKADLHKDDVHSGYVICDLKNPVLPVKEFLAQFLVLDKALFTSGYSAIIHIHTAVEDVTVTALMATLDKRTGKEITKKPKFAKQGDLLLVRMTLPQSVCITKFSDCPQLGRFTIREDKTVAVGKVTAIKPLK
uniref:Tr-type G domain-containing protein n=1 Tax=Percolomonas cosmopolitus TaxID=63605 RepID=A0A7S1KT15_9EUKA